jgi:hypothetical protein
MRKSTLKGAALAALAGTVLQFGGCLNLNRILQYGAWYAALEFVTDNDGVFDLFESGTVAAAQ